jgi:hypothetical protein
VATDRDVKAGQSIILRARFRDDLNQVSVASGVYVHIFEPDVDVSNLSLAYVVSGVPTYLGEGIYEYEFTAPDCGPEGTWYDKWVGELNCQDLSATLSFYVDTTTNITALGNQLFDNDVVEVTLASGILATDGSVSDEFTFEFMTTTSPSYTNLRKVRLEVGAFIPNTEDDTIQTAILEASIEADILTFNSVQVNSRLYQHARREYVTCLASSMLLNNELSSNLKRKSLADLSVEYDTSGLNGMLGKIQDCLEKWLPQLMSGGGAKAAKNASYVVKGSLDPDRPAVGRLWESGRNGFVTGNSTPAANTFGKVSSRRRYLSTYLPRTKKWW